MKTYQKPWCQRTGHEQFYMPYWSKFLDPSKKYWSKFLDASKKYCSKFLDASNKVILVIK